MSTTATNTATTPATISTIWNTTEQFIEPNGHSEVTSIILGGVVGLLLLLLGGVGTFFLIKKFKCCLKVPPIGDEKEMTPLTTAENPIPLSRFQNENEHCLPTEEEFEKLNKEDRYKNALPKSKNAGLEFVRTKTPINRYFTIP